MWFYKYFRQTDSGKIDEMSYIARMPNLVTQKNDNDSWLFSNIDLFALWMNPKNADTIQAHEKC